MTQKTLTCDEKDTISIYKQAKVMNPEIHHSNTGVAKKRKTRQKVRK